MRSWLQRTLVSLAWSLSVMHMVGQNRVHTPYMAGILVISLPKIPYVHRIYVILANPSIAHWFVLG